MSPRSRILLLVSALLISGAAQGDLIRHELPHTMVRPGKAQGIDFDRDGDADIVGSGRYEIGWWENDGQQDFDYHPIRDGLFEFVFFWAGDINGDGHNDIVFGTQDDTILTILLNDGTMQFPDEQSLGPVPITAFRQIEGHDVDGDGDMDLFSSSSFLLQYWEQVSPMDFVVDSLLSYTDFVEPGDQGRAGRFAVGDLDSDGDLDLAIPNKEHRLFLLELTANGYESHQMTNPPDYINGVDIADIISDGLSDIALATHGGDSPLLLVNLGAWEFIPYDTTATQQTDHVHVADWENDGDSDIIRPHVGGLSFYEQMTPGIFIYTSFGIEGSGIQNDVLDIDSDEDIDYVTAEPLGDTQQPFAWYENDYTTQEVVSLSLVPFSPPVILPPSGGSFNYSATIENALTMPRNGNAWVTVIDPQGIEHLMFVRPIQLQPGHTINVPSITQGVPWFAWSGNYTLIGRIGYFPNFIIEQDSFEFFKLPATSGEVSLEPNSR